MLEDTIVESRLTRCFIGALTLANELRKVGCEFVEYVSLFCS